MLEALIPELAACGLQRNVAKTKKLTTSRMKSSEFVDVCGEMVQFIHAESVHKYVGRNLSGNCLECVHRFQVAWNKFHKIQTYLLEQAYFFRFAAEII